MHIFCQNLDALHINICFQPRRVFLSNRNVNLSKTCTVAKTVWMWRLRTGAGGGLGNAGLKVVLNDHKGLSQPKQSHDSMIVVAHKGG